MEHRPIWLIVPVSWSIAFFEYCLVVSANRIGGRSMTWRNEKITLNHAVGFVLIAVGAVVVFKGPF